MKRVRDWLAWHSITKHVWAPIWLAIPEKRRWDTAHLLNKSRRYCWSDLVSDALTHRESDPCDTHTPTLRKTSERCGSVCGWMHPDHKGAHDCGCYCGKFQFSATEGSIERRVS